MDLSAIPTPLMTNVTAQSVVGIAPAQAESSGAKLPWPTLVAPKENTPAEKSGPIPVYSVNFILA